MENGERSVLPQRLVDARQAIGLTGIPSYLDCIRQNFLIFLLIQEIMIRGIFIKFFLALICVMGSLL